MRVLGRGASAKVYKAACLNQGFQSIVAVKVLNKKHQEMLSYNPVKDLQSEIRTHWALSQSGGGIKLLEIYEDDLYVFLVLDFAKKGTLQNAYILKG